MRTIITRADDCGCAIGANAAIFAAADAGFIKNISLMACGDHIEAAARILSHRKDICFGMHFCINSEWDRLKFTPAAPKTEIPLLLNADGEFYSAPEEMVRAFGERMAKTEDALLAQIYIEWKAQLTRLRRLGFTISYADTHMFPELHIPSLQETMRVWIAKENLLDHQYFYHLLPRMDDLAKNEGLFESVAGSLPEGQYFYLAHPALPVQDMYLTGNAAYPAEKVVADREKDYRFVTADRTLKLCQTHQIRTIRYDEAVRGDYGIFGF